jgi:hypothetical protein
MPRYRVRSGDFEQIITGVSHRQAALDAIGQCGKNRVLGSMTAVSEVFGQREDDPLYLLTFQLMEEGGISHREIN